MKRIAIALALGLAGCVSVTADGSKVKVYQAELASKDTMVPPLPTGCKLLGQSGPIDQQQQAFEISDPYRTERNNTAALGGNVLYVPFYRFKNLMKIDCPVGDTTPGCMDNEQSWYKVTFRSYACDTPALQALAESPLPAQPAIPAIEVDRPRLRPDPADNQNVRRPRPVGRSDEDDELRGWGVGRIIAWILLAPWYVTMAAAAIGVDVLFVKDLLGF